MIQRQLRGRFGHREPRQPPAVGKDKEQIFPESLGESGA